MARVANKEMGGLATSCTEFSNKNMSCFGRWALPTAINWGEYKDAKRHSETHPERMFVVISTYSTPLYIWSYATKEWYGNDAVRYKHINSQLLAHLRAAEPRGVDIRWLDEESIKEIVKWGVVRAVQRKFNQSIGH